MELTIDGIRCTPRPLPEPKHYGSCHTDRQKSWADGWNDCRAAIKRDGETPQRQCVPLEGFFGLTRAYADGWNACVDAMR